MIHFMNDVNNKEMIYHEKSSLQVFNKGDMICNSLHELIHNSVR